MMMRCYKDDVESQWKSLKFDPRYPKTPEPMATKMAGVITSRTSTPVQNCITTRLGDFVPHICEVAHQNVRSVSFWGFFQLATA